MSLILLTRRCCDERGSVEWGPIVVSGGALTRLLIGIGGGVVVGGGKCVIGVAYITPSLLLNEGVGDVELRSERERVLWNRKVLVNEV